MPSKICSKCGDNNQISAMVCTNCGNSLSDAKIIKSDIEILNNSFFKCPECGEKLIIGTRNCKYCGAFISKTIKNESYVRNYDYSKNSSISLFTYIISFLIPLIGFIIGAIFLTQDDYEKNDAGKVCIVLGVISILLNIIVISIII